MKKASISSVIGNDNKWLDIQSIRSRSSQIKITLAEGSSKLQVTPKVITDSDTKGKETH